MSFRPVKFEVIDSPAATSPWGFPRPMLIFTERRHSQLGAVGPETFETVSNHRLQVSTKPSRVHSLQRGLDKEGTATRARPKIGSIATRMG